jgi:hypothetical protein
MAITIDFPSSIGPLYLRQSDSEYFYLDDGSYRQLKATGVPPGLSFSMETGDSPRGTLHGTPTSVGTYSMTVSGVNAADSITPRTYSIVVNPVQPGEVDDLNVQDSHLSLDMETSILISTTPGYRPLKIVAGQVPPGLTFSSPRDGSWTRLSGRPNQEGSFSFTLDGADPEDLFTQKEITIEVGPAMAPTITTRRLSPFFIDNEYSFYGSFSVKGSGTLDTTIETDAPTDYFDVYASGDFAVVNFLGYNGYPEPGSHYTVTVGSSSEYGSVSKTFDLYVYDSSFSTEPLIIITQAFDPPTGYIGQPYDFQLLAEGSPPITWGDQYDLEVLPEWMTIDPDGRVHGTPDRPDFTAVHLSVTGAGDFDQAYIDFYVQIDDSNPVVVVTDSVPVARVAESYSFQLLATGGVAPYTFTLSGSDGLPAGLSMSSDGLITGMATEEAEKSIQVTVRDSSGYDYRVSSSYLTLASIDYGKPYITSTGYLTTIPNFTPVSIQLAVDGRSPITWTVGEGSQLPSGLTLDPSGVIVGSTDVVSGTAELTVVASNSSGSASAAISFDITDSRPLRVATSELPPAYAGSTYKLQLFAMGGKPAYTWEALDIPDWLNLTDSGFLTGDIPAEPSEYRVSVRAHDDAGRTASAIFELTGTALEPSIYPDDEEWLSIYRGRR